MIYIKGLVVDSKIWQELLILESRDGVANLYFKIHSRKINKINTIAINNAAKQAKEYFRNSYNANYSVKPLLTFYGVASLSRALILLLKRSGGEETLSMGHGLTTESWRETFSGSLEENLNSLLNLRISSTSGLFTDLLKAINNTTCIHTNGSHYNWSIPYSLNDKYDFKFGDILKRLPDVYSDLITANQKPLASSISNIVFNQESGLEINCYNGLEQEIIQLLTANNYIISDDNKTITSSADNFSKFPVIFTHTILNKMFGGIPSLYFSPPMNENQQLSEIAMLYISSFIMSMLVRYYPTIWVSIAQGEKGDVFWPTIYKTQQLVETAFPELVLEFINYTVESSSEE